MMEWFGIKPVVRAILKLAICAGGAVLVFSYAGHWHPAGDSFAVFRMLVALGLVVLCLLHWRWRFGWAVGVVSLGIVGQLLGERLEPFAPPPSERADLVVYQKNLLYVNRDPAATLRDILAADADFVTLQEVSRANEPLLGSLMARYPYALRCPVVEVIGQVVVLSRVPIDASTCFDGFGAGMIEVRVKDRPVRVVSLHLYWPWPFEQQAGLQERAAFLQTPFDGVTVIGGDFNMVPEGSSLETVAAWTGTARVGHHVTTYELFGYPLSIDHVMVTGGQGWIEQRPRAGSDHYGVLAHLKLPSAP